MVLIAPENAGEPEFRCRAGDLVEVYLFGYMYLKSYLFGAEGHAIPYRFIFS
jgi:hypothetical protein